MDAVTLGETMVMMAPNKNGSLKHVDEFTKSIAGAESNFAIALSRLGFETGWISSLGRDSFGDYIEFFIRGEGVDVSQVVRDEKHATGVMYKEIKGLGETKVYYYRKDSAASQMSPKILDGSYLKQFDLLHLTGITLALSETSKKTVFEAVKLARENGLKISFDPNLRLKLWDDMEKMRREILKVCRLADIILPGLKESRFLFQAEDPEKIIDEFLKYNPEVVVLKMGEQGSMFSVKNGEYKKVAAYDPGKVIDPIGAGDGFSAGFIAGLLEGKSYYESLKLGNAVGAFVLSVKGDVEGLPVRSELNNFLEDKDVILR